MNVAVQVEFKADRKEPLGELVRRVAALFQQSELERTFVREIEAAVGPVPAWFEPGR